MTRPLPLPLQVYMLMELEPAKEITGGPWYGADAFDVEFIEVLQKVCTPPFPLQLPDDLQMCHHTVSKPVRAVQATYSFIKSQGDATLQEIADFIKDKVGLQRAGGCALPQEGPGL